MTVIRRKRMERAEALKILELSDWAACDEIEAAYIRLKARFQSERVGLFRIERLFSEAQSILLNDAGRGSERSSTSSLKFGAWGYFREWLIGRYPAARINSQESRILGTGRRF